MKVTDALLGEHGVMNAIFDHVEQLLAAARTVADVRSAAGVVTATLVSHARIEDELLFPALERHLGPAGPLVVMRHEHEEIERALEAAAAAQTPADAHEHLRRALGIAHEHFAKEEQVLFRMAHDVLSDAELEQLGASWAAARRVWVGPAGAR